MSTVTGWSIIPSTCRRADFGPIAHLFRDEFTILCLGAYDELATVRAYRANLPKYEKLGPEFRERSDEIEAARCEPTDVHNYVADDVWWPAWA